MKLVKKNPAKWSLKVVDHLFTDEELASNVLEVYKNELNLYKF